MRRMAANIKQRLAKIHCALERRFGRLARPLKQRRTGLDTLVQTILIQNTNDTGIRADDEGVSVPLNFSVEFYGQYEWSREGGVIHWTHRDPNGYHVGGWLKHMDVTYQ